MKRQKKLKYNELKIEVFVCFPNSRKTSWKPLSDIHVFCSNQGKLTFVTVFVLKLHKINFIVKGNIFYGPSEGGSLFDIHLDRVTAFLRDRFF